ncbi:P-II family nitrogen regulator [Scytonema sp. NUACC26]|uniref:P-II family nitrogen regulator n=1 Tax=Scytonema sp. NUACC26 TaxID=3140176 RepID=UPI0034DBECF3
MQLVSRVEIIISTLELREVIDILDSVRVTGYTLIENTSGKGKRGFCYNDLGREFSNSYISTFCTTQKQLGYLLGDILPILKRISGVCLITETNAVSSDQLSQNIDLAIAVMQEVKKVEIIIDTSYIEDTLKILESVSVSGYTIIKDTSGKGERGLSCPDIDCLFSSSYIMTVCTNEKQLDSLVQKITPSLKKIGGVCLVTDAKWVNH